MIGADAMSAYSYRQPSPGQALLVKPEVLTHYAGRHTVVCCFGSGRDGRGRAALDSARAHKRLFDGTVNFIGVSIDPKDLVEDPLPPSIKFFFDKTGAVSRLCGAAPLDDLPLGSQYRITWTVMDPFCRVIAHYTGADADTCGSVFDLVSNLAARGVAAYDRPAPILLLPRVFDAELCAKLIGLYETGQPRQSGVMRANVEVFDDAFKRRRDFFVDDPADRDVINKRISLCVIPEIRNLFFMEITRIERYLVGCYASEDQGHFRPHRDNNEKITAHRRFAVSVALNEDYEGGELQFPEYSSRRHKAPTGWAIIFPCAILHTVAQVTKGRRYALLPFLFDEAGARIQSQFIESTQ